MSPSPRVHIVGAGLAGLAAATALVSAGSRVCLYEATGQAGGRCRSLHDPHLDRIIDNGNHLLLSGNHAAGTYLDRIGGRQAMMEIAPATLPFRDLQTRDDWMLRPGPGTLPLWLLSRRRRVPSSRLRDYLALIRLLRAPPGSTVADILPLETPLGRRLWHPLAVAILNTDPREADAGLLRTVFQRTILLGETACRPLIAGPGGLSAALVDPALALLERAGAPARFHHRLVRIAGDAEGVTALDFGAAGTVALGPADQVILALPPDACAMLLPGQVRPMATRAIINAHFRLPEPLALPRGLPLLGLIGGTAEWLFQRGDVISVTVSAADRLVTAPNDRIASQLWADVAMALDRADIPCPPYRIIKEKRATFAATPAAINQRPACGDGGIDRLWLAGDWTDTGLPATIEGAVQSGHAAADAVLHTGSRAATTRRPSASRTL